MSTRGPPHSGPINVEDPTVLDETLKNLGDSHKSSSFSSHVLAPFSLDDGSIFWALPLPVSFFSNQAAYQIEMIKVGMFRLFNPQ